MNVKARRREEVRTSGVGVEHWESWVSGALTVVWQVAISIFGSGAGRVCCPGVFALAVSET